MKKIITSCLLFVSIAVCGQTTYIPRYKSFVQITHNGDTLRADNTKRSLDISDNKFSISIQHEDVTREKVKSIKRAKSAAGWATFSSVMATIAPGDRGSIFSRVQDIKVSSKLAEIAQDRASAEEELEIEAWIENKTDEELLAASLDEGRVWYIQPHQTIAIKIPNPCETIIRLSDIHSRSVSLVTIAACSVVKKETVSWQDDSCWVIEVAKKKRLPTEDKEIIGYMHVDKETFENTWMTYKEFESFKKKHQ